MKRIGGETIPTVRCFYQLAHWSLDIAEERTGTADLGRADARWELAIPRHRLDRKEIQPPTTPHWDG